MGATPRPAAHQHDVPCALHVLGLAERALQEAPGAADEARRGAAYVESRLDDRAATVVSSHTQASASHMVRSSSMFGLCGALGYAAMHN